MMNPTTSTLFRLTLMSLALALPGSCLASDFDLEASIAGGSNDNLFSDSSGQYSNSTVSSLDLGYVAASFARLNLIGEYTYYRHVSRLSNLVYGGGLTLIPTPDSSRMSLYFTGNVRNREYRDDNQDTVAINANEFTGNEYDAVFGVGYDLTERVQLRSALSFRSTGYDIDGVLDRNTYEISLGVNGSLWNRVGLDLEFGYARGRYQYINPVRVDPIAGEVPRTTIGTDEAYDILLEDDLRSIYLSPRVSTSFGQKTGVSLTWSIRKFQDYNRDQVIYGYSSGYLSPWKESYEGQAVILNVKTYLVPRLNVSLMAGYWDRDYLQVVEYETWFNNFGMPRSGVSLLNSRERTDYRSRLSLSVKMPLSHRVGYSIEPSLTLDYTDNSSSVPVYKYSSFLVSGGLTVRF